MSDEHIEHWTGDRMVKEIRRLRSEVAELKEDLLEYGGHLHSCHKHTYPLSKRCDCGWIEVVTRYDCGTAPARQGGEMSNICVGRPIIEILAKEGAWCNSDGDCVIAASDLYGNDPYAELDRLQMENAELLAFVKAYRDIEHPNYLWSLSTALLEKHTIAQLGKEER